MTEEEYINLENLTKIRTVLEIIRGILPDDLVKIEDRTKIEGKLMDWRDELQRKIKIK